MHRDAVFLHAPRGAIPAIVDATRCVSRQFSISLMVTGGTLMLGGASAATVQPIIDAIGARRWIPLVAPPVRLLCEPGGGSVAMVRLPAADRGHDLQWLVDTGGDIGADIVAVAVGRQINGMVSGAPVTALHPETETFCDMIAIRVSPDRATSMRALVAMGGCVHVGGRDC